MFAPEVPTVGRFRTDLLVPALTAALTGDIVTRALGVHHDARVAFAPMTLNFANLARAAGLGVVCGWLHRGVRRGRPHPLTCAVLVAELFGGSVLPFATVTCLVVTLCSTRRSMYLTQRHAASG